MRINFEIIYEKKISLILTPTELIENYLFGISLQDRQGNTISSSTLEFYIQSAQEEMEKYLSISLTRKIVKEEYDYNLSDWRSWGYLRTNYPVEEPYELKGFVNTAQQMDLPKAWLSARRDNGGIPFRHIYTVPVSAVGVQHSAIYNGVIPLGFFTNNTIPNYWKAVYGTGFSYEKLPKDIMGCIGKLAAINIFHIVGDLILNPGIVSKSISIDGLSQSFSTSGRYGQRVKAYLDDLNVSLPRLYNYYKGFTVISL